MLTMSLAIVDMFLERNWILHIVRALAHIGAQILGSIVGAILILVPLYASFKRHTLPGKVVSRAMFMTC